MGIRLPGPGGDQPGIIEAEHHQEHDRRVEEGIAGNKPRQQWSGSGHADQSQAKLDPHRTGNGVNIVARQPAYPAGRTNDLPSPLVPFVMAGLAPAIHRGRVPLLMAGSSPAMTVNE